MDKSVEACGSQHCRMQRLYAWWEFSLLPFLYLSIGYAWCVSLFLWLFMFPGDAMMGCSRPASLVPVILHRLVPLNEKRNQVQTTGTTDWVWSHIPWCHQGPFDFSGRHLHPLFTPSTGNPCCLQRIPLVNPGRCKWWCTSWETTTHIWRKNTSYYWY